MKKISKEKFSELWPEIGRKYQLFLPVEEDGVVNFKPYEKGAKVNFNAVNTVRPPKEIFFPQTDNYLSFYSKKGSLRLEAVEPAGEKPLFLLGVRPCDVESFAILDRVFLQEPQDLLYSKRRQNALVAALACSKPGPTCFCTVFGLEPGAAPGADLLLHKAGDSFFLRGQSSKGQQFLEQLEGYLREASSSEQEMVEEQAQETALKEAAAARQKGWQLEAISDFLKDKFEWDFWEKLYRRCLGCGICTYLCPTCHCFDVEDFAKGEEGLRFRCWDSCMFAEFTLMASGENPRPSRKERVRNRFLHKLCYYPSRHGGAYACVGCGRCLLKCPVGIDITQVIKAAGGEMCASS